MNIYAASFYTMIADILDILYINHFSITIMFNSFILNQSLLSTLGQINAMTGTALNL
jgi:hypothetical protein